MFLKCVLNTAVKKESVHIYPSQIVYRISTRNELCQQWFYAEVHVLQLNSKLGEPN